MRHLAIEGFSEFCEECIGEEERNESYSSQEIPWNKNFVNSNLTHYQFLLTTSDTNEIRS